MPQNALHFPITDLGDVPHDLLDRFHRNGLMVVQDVQDEGKTGCLQIGLNDGDIMAINEMLDKNGFERIE